MPHDTMISLTFFMLFLYIWSKSYCLAFCNRRKLLSAPSSDLTKRRELIDGKVKPFCGTYKQRRRHPTQVAREEDGHHATTRKYHYDLTILIPAYNELDRIGNTLSTYISYLKHSSVCLHPSTTGNVTILVIDDGSTDGTADFVRGKSYLEAVSPFESSDNLDCWTVEDIQCISLAQNEGKGAAIERGMREISTNQYSCETARQMVLVCDADGSGDIQSCLNDMVQRLELLLRTQKNSKPDSTSDALVVGYRVCKDKSLLRSILSWGFRTAVSTVFFGSNLGVRDTQCGFKLMTLTAGKRLFNDLNLRRWTHDCEILHRAKLFGIPVSECEVPWVDAEGSKLVTSATSAITMSFVMLKEIAAMRVNYAAGRWR